MERHTINLEFFASYELFEQIPILNCQEIAFVGASNSGKSSAINLLANNKKLSYTSKKPGKTKLFNYFKKDKNCLIKVKFKIWNGLIFINLDNNAKWNSKKVFPDYSDAFSQLNVSNYQIGLSLIHI
mgnify:CR=1 FL=1